MTKRAQPSQDPGFSAGTRTRLNMGAVASVGNPSAGQTVSQPSHAATAATAPRIPLMASTVSPVSIADHDPEVVPMGARWQGILKGQSPLALSQRFGLRLFSL